MSSTTPLSCWLTEWEASHTALEHHTHPPTTPRSKEEVQVPDLKTFRATFLRFLGVINSIPLKCVQFLFLSFSHWYEIVHVEEMYSVRHSMRLFRIMCFNGVAISWKGYAEEDEGEGARECSFCDHYILLTCIWPCCWYCFGWVHRIMDEWEKEHEYIWIGWLISICWAPEMWFMWLADRTVQENGNTVGSWNGKSFNKYFK